MNIIQKLYFHLWVWRTKKERKFIDNLKVMSITQTIDVIVKEGKSISRFGDGELLLMMNARDIYFQKSSKALAEKLTTVINSNLPNHLVCINAALVSQKGLKQQSKAHWIDFANKYSQTLQKLIQGRNYVFGNALISRFYLHKTDKTDVPYIVGQLKKIWHEKDILIVEGAYSRLGIGNDLFSNSKSLSRIICPTENAFDNYDAILEKTLAFGKDKLVILALGPTATILAYDLCAHQIQALDLGHIDIEYSWYLSGATERIAIKGKKGGEVAEYDLTLSAEDSKTYHDSILYTF